MSIVAGVDFGTLSVRVSIVDSERGRLGSGVAEYPLFRTPGDPDHATQSHAEHLLALAEATGKALEAAGVSGEDVAALAIDTTGSSVIPVDEDLQPLNDYYLWCDHRSWREALEITAKAHEQKLAAIRQVEALPPTQDAPERVRQLAEMNRANGTLLARRQRAVIWTLRQLGRVESGAYNARGHTNTSAIGRPIAIA